MTTMCEYAIAEENKPFMCEYTKKLCTLCVLGNADTYNKAKEKDSENE